MVFAITLLVLGLVGVVVGALAVWRWRRGRRAAAGIVIIALGGVAAALGIALTTFPGVAA